uniref:Putative phosphatidylinositol transfer protein sec14 n=1 Tax=Lutzomyia longipalpis TaxID=7200 RepID=A0A1B0C8N5_LUTLO
MYKVSRVSVQDVYERTPELKKKEVEGILTWTHNQRHLPKITEYEAAIFHHSRYFNFEETKKAIDIYFTHRAKNPNIFRDRDPQSDELRPVIESQVFYPLPKTLPSGYSGMFFAFVNPDTKKFNCTSTLKLASMMMDYWHMTEGISKGHSLVVNMQGFSLGHLFRLHIGPLRAFVAFAQEYIPLRLKEIHFVNSNRVTQRFIGILKPFLKKEVYEMMKIHTSMEAAYECIPREYFPSDLGGSWKSTAQLQEDMTSILMENKKNFQDEDTERNVEESLRG